LFIGITGYNHESSAALVDSEGYLIDYYREECLSRIKGDKSFPKRAINRIMNINNLNYNDINSIAFYERPLSSFLTTLRTAALNLPESLPLISHQCRNFDKSSVSCFLDIAKLNPGLEKKLIYLDHHLSHTLTSIPYSDIQSNVCSIVVDGFGDRSTTSISQVNNLYDIQELWTCDYPISLGLFYSAITDFLGFQVNEGEFKVMGLSSFGNPSSDVAQDVFNLIKWDMKENKIIQDMRYFSYHISLKNSFSKELVSLLGEPRNPFIPLLPDNKDFQYYADIAMGAQLAVTEILCQIFKYANLLTGSKNFLFSGGVAMNSASLDKISSLSCVEQITIPPSPGDAGSAIGAAFFAYLKSSTKTIKKLPKPSLYPSRYKKDEQQNLASKIINNKFKLLASKEDEILKLSAALIKKGYVLGTVIDNAETGPRALGNRSLICDGRNKKAVSNLNTVIKNRSPFRPTAPCMKLEVAKKYYILKEELMDSYKCMGSTCKCKENSLSLDFPTTHVDKTARLQLVESGHFLDKLLDELENYNIDTLANSSLNLSGDPTCFDLIDALMISARNPLKYIITNFGLLESIA